MSKPAILLVEGFNNLWWGRLILEGIGEFEVDGMWSSRRQAEEVSRATAKLLGWPIAYEKETSDDSNSCCAIEEAVWHRCGSTAVSPC